MLTSLVNPSDGFIDGIINENVYIHSAAADALGRISDTTHFFMVIDPTFTFTESDTFIESLPQGATFIHSSLLTYLWSVTMTVTPTLCFLRLEQISLIFQQI